MWHRSLLLVVLFTFSLFNTAWADKKTCSSDSDCPLCENKTKPGAPKGEPKKPKCNQMTQSCVCVPVKSKDSIHSSTSTSQTVDIPVSPN